MWKKTSLLCASRWARPFPCIRRWGRGKTSFRRIANHRSETWCVLVVNVVLLDAVVALHVILGQPWPPMISSGFCVDFALLELVVWDSYSGSYPRFPDGVIEMIKFISPLSTVTFLHLLKGGLWCWNGSAGATDMGGLQVVVPLTSSSTSCPSAGPW